MADAAAHFAQGTTGTREGRTMQASTALNPISILRPALNMVYGSGFDFHRTLGLISNTPALSVVARYSLRHANTFFCPFFPRERAIKACVISVTECLDAAQRDHNFTSRSICSELAIAEIRGKYNSNQKAETTVVRYHNGPTRFSIQ